MLQGAIRAVVALVPYSNGDRLKKKFPAIPVETVDERYTSKMASQAMIDMGMKKMQRRNKALVDEIAATIMLQEYLQKKG